MTTIAEIREALDNLEQAPFIMTEAIIEELTKTTDARADALREHQNARNVYESVSAKHSQERARIIAKGLDGKNAQERDADLVLKMVEGDAELARAKEDYQAATTALDIATDALKLARYKARLLENWSDES